MRRGNLLTFLILIGLIAGALVGHFVFFDEVNRITDSHWTKQAGDLVLIRPLTLLIIPLIFVSVIVGVTSIGDPSKLGLVGGSTLLYYFITMLFAVTLGTTLVSVFQPGELAEEDRTALVATAEAEYGVSDARKNIEQAEAEDKTKLGGAWLNILRQVIPTNIVNEMSEGRTLGVIVFALLLGLALALGGDATAPATRFFESMFDAMMRLVLIIIWLTPIGVFLLVAWTIGKIGIAAIVGPLSKYMLIVFVGLAIHGLIVLPIVLAIAGRANPLRFMWQMRRALLTAFGTDSSAATLPVTIESAETEGGCSRRSANFVLPLGATINMDGTALYEAVAVVFLFQLYGIDLSFGELLIVVITATLAAVGAAGIPSAGLVTMVIVISAVNTSLRGQGHVELPIAAIGVIIGVDRILDMCRTTINVWGDAVGAKIITKLAPD